MKAREESENRPRLCACPEPPTTFWLCQVPPAFLYGDAIHTRVPRQRHYFAERSEHKRVIDSQEETSLESLLPPASRTAGKKFCLGRNDE